MNLASIRVLTDDRDHSIGCGFLVVMILALLF